jgi:predicted regulator of Ras-like GTPase activity (Roadblock/LC7/MglB family)
VTTELLVGPTGSFIVTVDGEVVAEKKSMDFPSEDEIVAAVRSRLQKS